MDAVTMLRGEHREVEKLFKKLEKGDLSVVPTICEELTQHTRKEEEVFYPAVREQVEDETDDVLESLEEHHVVKTLIRELGEMSEDDERYEAKATVLMEMVRHHVEEEEQDMFPAVREAMGRKELQALADRMGGSS